MPSGPWYAARCVFRYADLRVRGRAVYEERIVLLRAAGFRQALRRAEAEARRYAHDSKAEYVGFAEVFQLDAAEVGDGTEVFSLMRHSRLTPDRYVARFFDTGAEHRRDD